MTGRQELAVGALVVVLVAAVSMAITMQGWQSRIIAFDLLTYVYDANDFLATGTLPQHGDTGSTGSYKPPGTAWLMMPSLLLTSDPRLVEYAGTALLHLGALAGIFLLGRRYFGLATALVAVVLYGISAHGLFLAGSLWPNGRPDFFVLIVLAASQWIVGRDPRFLALALGLWGIGMYVDLALAPALLIFPALWLYYRPPIRLLPLGVAAAVLLLVWAPYLQLQLDRGFADVRAQVLLQYILPADYASAWCDPGRQMHAVAVSAADVPPAAADRGAVANAAAVAVGVGQKTLSNFSEATVAPLGGILLGLLTAAGVLLTSAGAADKRAGHSAVPRRGWTPSRRQLTIAGVSLIAVGLVIHQFPLEAGLAATAQRIGIALAVVGAAVLVLPWLVHAVDQLAARRDLRLAEPARVEARRLLVIALLIPWVLLVALAEPDKPERFWWVWPLQVIFLAALLVHWLPRFVPRGVVAATLAIVLLVVAVNWAMADRVGSWRETGWAGADAAQIRVIDFVADRLRADGARTSSVGYQTYFFPFMAEYHVTNPVYKVGADWDIFFRYRHGIANVNQCAEGLSDADEYRIIQTRRRAEDWRPRHYFDLQPDPGFELIGDFDLYQVWQRSGPAG